MLRLSSRYATHGFSPFPEALGLKQQVPESLGTFPPQSVPEQGSDLYPHTLSPLILWHLHLWVFIGPGTLSSLQKSAFLCFSFLCLPLPAHHSFFLWPKLTEHLPLSAC